MSFAQEKLLGAIPANRSANVHWPQDATFAVGRATLRSLPLWLIEALTRLTTVEKACANTGTLTWAHSLERLWFELLDAQLVRAGGPVTTERDMLGACFLGAR